MFCKKCGNELPEEAKFCGKCGSKVMQSDNLNNNESKKNKSKLWKIIIIIIIVIIVVIGVVWFAVTKLAKSEMYSDGQNMNTQEENNTNEVEEKLVKYKKDEIRNMIGKYVDYKPTSGNYTAKATLTGGNNNYDKEVGNQNFWTEDMKWRIWSIDDKNIMLISETMTSEGGANSDGRLSLFGNKGYENGVTIINEICESCYTNMSYKGMQARSLNLTDIESVIDKNKINIEKIKKEIIDEGKREFGYVRVEINTWGRDIEYDEYQNEIYAEMVHEIGKIADYYLANQTTVKASYEEDGEFTDDHLGIQVIDGGDNITIAPLEETMDLAANEYESCYAIRPCVIIPLNSFSLDMSGKGSKLDMWKISTK